MKYTVVQAQDGTIVVTVESSHLDNSLYVNGKRLQKGTYSFPGDKPVLSQRGHEVKQLQAAHPKRTGLPVLSAKEWETTREELWSKRLSAGDSVVWACLADKEAYETFVNDYEPVYIWQEYLTEPKDIRVEAIPILTDKEPYITPGYVIGEALDTRFGIYERQALWLAEIKTFAAEHGLVESSNITGCRKGQYHVYLHVYQNELTLYLEGKQLFERRGITPIHQEMGKLILMRDQDIEFLHHEFTLWANRHAAVREVIDAGALLAKLRQLQNQIAKIKPYRKSASDWRTARSTAKALTDEVERALLQQKEKPNASIQS